MTKTGNSTKQRNFCNICCKTVIGSSYKYRAHLFQHDAVTSRYECKFCLKKFFRRDTYKQHLNKHEARESPKRYICDYCSRGFVIKTNLIRHLQSIHDEDIDTKIRSKFQCTICDIYYCERRLLDNHVRKNHFNIKSNKEPRHINKLINESWIERVVNKNTCVQITKVNDNVIMIKRLKVEDVKVNDIEANTLDTSNECVDQYSKAVCDYCRKEMLKKSLRSHIREVHMNIRKFPCKQCKFSFSRHYQLVDHKCGQFKPKKRYTVRSIKKMASTKT